jgi:hypothetical protein
VSIEKHARPTNPPTQALRREPASTPAPGRLGPGPGRPAAPAQMRSPSSPSSAATSSLVSHSTAWSGQEHRLRRHPGQPSAPRRAVRAPAPALPGQPRCGPQAQLCVARRPIPVRPAGQALCQECAVTVRRVDRGRAPSRRGPGSDPMALRPAARPDSDTVQQRWPCGPACSGSAPPRAGRPAARRLGSRPAPAPPSLSMAGPGT